MSGLMTWEEIKETFDSEWVLIEDPELTRSQELIRGKVVFHSPDRAAVYSKAIELRPPRTAIRYIGGLPEGVEMIL